MTSVEPVVWAANQGSVDGLNIGPIDSSDPLSDRFIHSRIWDAQTKPDLVAKYVEARNISAARYAPFETEWASRKYPGDWGR